MNEPIIAYTLFALVITGLASLVAGTVIGWSVKQAKSQREAYDLKKRIKDNRLELHDSHAELAQLSQQLEKLSKVQHTAETRGNVIEGLQSREESLNQQIQLVEEKFKQQSQSYLDLKRQLQLSNNELKKSNVRLKSLAENQVTLQQKLKNEALQKLNAERRAAALVNSAKQSPEQKQGPSARVKSQQPVFQHRIRKPQVPANTSAAAAIVSPAATHGAGLSNSETLTDLTQGSLQHSAESKAQTNEVQSTPAVASKQPKAANTGPKVGPGAQAATTKARVTAPKAVAKAVAKDDLKMIKGIGPAIERTLNKIGIERFDQIAALSQQQHNKMHAELKQYKARMLRDDWIGSAEQLFNKKKAG